MHHADFKFQSIFTHLCKELKWDFSIFIWLLHSRYIEFFLRCLVLCVVALCCIWFSWHCDVHCCAALYSCYPCYRAFYRRNIPEQMGTTLFLFSEYIPHIKRLRSWAVQWYGVLYQSISKKGTKVYPLYIEIAVECTQSCTKYICA